MEDIAPNDDLREWFDHDPDRWNEFVRRYRNELDHRPERVREPLEYTQSGTLTLHYAATDEEHNNAVVLADYLADRLDEG